MFKFLTLLLTNTVVFPSVQPPHLAQCPGSNHALCVGLQHSAMALPDPGTAILPQTAAFLPQVDV